MTKTCIRSSAVAPCESRAKSARWVRGRGYTVGTTACLICGHVIARPVPQLPREGNPLDILKQALLKIAEWAPGANQVWATNIAGHALAEVADIEDTERVDTKSDLRSRIGDER